MLEWMRSDPLGFFQFMLYRAPAVLLALTLHEIAHGYVAYLCGDDTAKRMGRLSLNPAKHLSLIGTLLMFSVGMGWAKPVPVNPHNLRGGRRDDFFVSIAGVTVNFLLFSIATVCACLVARAMLAPAYADYYGYNFFLSFNEDGFWYIISCEKDALPDILRVGWLIHPARFLYQFALCNLGMCLFNLLPFPPLDGFHVVNDILLRGKLQLSPQVFRGCMLALLLLMNVTDIFSNLISKALYFVQGGVLSAALSLLGMG